MNKTDLHIHSIYSDGTFSVDEILHEAKVNDVKILSITDHNCMDAYDDFHENENIKMIPGVEIDSVEEGIDFHILGYGFDLKNESFRKFIKENQERLELVNIKLLEKVMVDHPALSLEEYHAFDYDKKLGGWKLLHYFVHKGLCESIWDGFELYDRYQHSYACVNFPSIDEVCDQIHMAGGKAVLAHPGKVIPYDSKESFEAYLKKLLKHDLDGIECFYPSHDEEITNICLKLCHENGLLITCGSDCHGGFEKTKIGELNIPLQLLNL